MLGTPLSTLYASLLGCELAIIIVTDEETAEIKGPAKGMEDPYVFHSLQLHS